MALPEVALTEVTEVGFQGSGGHLPAGLPHLPGTRSAAPAAPPKLAPLMPRPQNGSLLPARRASADLPGPDPSLLEVRSR